MDSDDKVIIILMLAIGGLIVSFFLMNISYNYKHAEDDLFITPNKGRQQSYRVETCIVNDEASEVEYFMYDDDENFSKVLVKDDTAYVFDKNGQIVNVFSGFILKYNNQKG